MKLDTVRFGEIDVDESRIFEFVIPIIGFDSLKKFVVLEPNKGTLFKWLQSIEDSALAFPIISASALNFNYTIVLQDSVIDILKITNTENVLVMNIMSIPQDDPKGATVNLLAPLILNMDNQTAGQVVLSGSGYDISYPMFK